MSFTYQKTPLNDYDGYQLRFFNDHQCLSVAEVFSYLLDQPEFSRCFTQALLANDYLAVRWECRGIDKRRMPNPFECVVLHDPTLHRPADLSAFRAYLPTTAFDEVAVFRNLSGEALLVVPGQGTQGSDFSHLKQFLLTASTSHIQLLLQNLAKHVLQELGDTPIYPNTAGDAVPWLHCRIDRFPKYYGYLPYRT